MGRPPPVLLKEVDAQKHDVSRLGVGEHLAPGKVCVCVLQPAGHGEKHGCGKGLRHLAPVLFEKSEPTIQNARLLRMSFFQYTGIFRARAMCPIHKIGESLSSKSVHPAKGPGGQNGFPALKQPRLAELICRLTGA